MAQKEVPVGPITANEMKLKRKYLVRKSGNVGTKKGGNSGGTGKKAKAKKRGIVVSSRNSPEQYGRWVALMKSNGEPILG